MMLSNPIITGCRSVPSKEIVLPPKPQREVRPEVKTMEDIGLLISYYENLVSAWELWGESAEKIIEECK